MRKVREITEGFRTEVVGSFNVFRRNPVEKEPIGTILLVPMRIVGYDPDCDGSLMARMEVMSLDDLDDPLDPEILAADMLEARRYGVHTNCGLYDSTGIVATPDEIRALVSAL